MTWRSSSRRLFLPRARASLQAYDLIPAVSVELRMDNGCTV